MELLTHDDHELGAVEGDDLAVGDLLSGDGSTVAYAGPHVDDHFRIGGDVLDQLSVHPHASVRVAIDIDGLHRGAVIQSGLSRQPTTWNRMKRVQVVIRPRQLLEASKLRIPVNLANISTGILLHVLDDSHHPLHVPLLALAEFLSHERLLLPAELLPEWVTQRRLEVASVELLVGCERLATSRHGCGARGNALQAACRQES
mmetsp:Transcript_32363/g.65411  ORF Transcript_32363/g.65411 Transcript_32363/m.65411 type:complete len:202 (+) Transcript_32363:509-1114(+)